MIASRGRDIVGLLNKSRVLKPSLNNLFSRSSGRWAYRENIKPFPWQERTADALGAIGWGWIVYHFINDYELITGEFSNPDSSQWTDEELGIPPDSAGL